MVGLKPGKAGSAGRFNGMHPIRWVPPGAGSLLDVGCNVGVFLSLCDATHPGMELAGVEVNPEALDAARRRLPDADLRLASAHDLPFEDRAFDCLTCIEVLEHIPAELRPRSLAEMHRVLRPGGRLVLRVPHAGAFAFLDSNNLRFRFPRLYRGLIGRGLRDRGYENSGSAVVWHHHFTNRELLGVAGDGWELESSRRGGLLIFPLIDLARWPFYRAGLGDHAMSRLLERVADLDIGFDYGRTSFDVLMILRRV
ncbi:class I SAM-dependent methyltransferase (plasmid) [Tundrisphaera sp. TA3]|uniref:class I SAM-dependent methyltransferase n=1 Tax=Tundrisphaera sp. TA3 TaxID=3435775 RepID=UPI003EBDC868